MKTPCTSIKGLMAVAMAVATVGCAPQNQAKTPVIDAPVATVNPPLPRPTPETPRPVALTTPAPAAPAGDGTQIVGNQVKGQLYFPTGDPASSALLLEKVLPTEVQVNKPFMYEIRVTNVTKLKLEGVEITELVPGTFKIRDATEGSPDGKPNPVNIVVAC